MQLQCCRLSIMVRVIHATMQKGFLQYHVTCCSLLGNVRTVQGDHQAQCAPLKAAHTRQQQQQEQQHPQGQPGSVPRHSALRMQLGQLACS